MSLITRISKLEKKLAPIGQLMIFVSNDETIKSALDSFNKKQGYKLTEKDVSGWNTLPYKEHNGYFLLSPSWRFENWLLEMKKNRKG
jgi:hypothetical protein